MCDPSWVPTVCESAAKIKIKRASARIRYLNPLTRCFWHYVIDRDPANKRLSFEPLPSILNPQSPTPQAGHTAAREVLARPVCRDPLHRITCIADNACFDPGTGNTYLYGYTRSTYVDIKCPVKCGYDTGKITRP